jgi:hypothetical protein
MIVIKSKVDGFRRCGVAHSVAATSYEDGHYSKSELDALQAEPLLEVEVVKDPNGRQTKAATAKAVKKEAR